MSRYIDADEFLENESEAYMRAQVNLAEEHADKTIDATRYVNEAVHKKIQMLINATESADLVEVVRCKDCKYGEWRVSELDNKTKGYECAIHAVFENDFGDNGYCSYGERKDDE